MVGRTAGGWDFALDMGAWQGTIGVLSDIGMDVEPNMREASRHLRREIQTRAPVETGRLRDSYRVEVQNGPDGPTGHIGTDVPYAVHQEYGTRFQSGQPHVRPALDANRDVIADMVLSPAFNDL